jgi:hypothetical protein
MAVGNTFGATALSSYGGFWLSFAIILTPGGFDIVASIEKADGGAGFTNSFGLYLMVRLTHLFPPSSSPPPPKSDSSVTGLVHFHLHPTAVHPEIDCRILLTLLHA